MNGLQKTTKVNDWNTQAVKSFSKSWRHVINPYIKYMLDFCLPSDYILDLGCGFGRLFEYLLKNKQGPLIYTGYDSSLPMLNKFKEDFPAYKDSVHFHDITKPFNHRPSCIITSAIFMHLLFKDQLKVLDNIAAVHPDRITFDIDSHNLNGKELVEEINQVSELLPSFRFTRQTTSMLEPELTKRFPDYKINIKSFKGCTHPTARPDVYVFTLEKGPIAYDQLLGTKPWNN